MISFCQVNLNFYLNSIKYYSHGEKFKGDFFFKSLFIVKKPTNKKPKKKIENPCVH